MTELSQHSPTTYRTHDMSLVVYLTILGHTHQSLVRTGRRCLWEFATVGNFMELVDGYFNGNASADVEDTIRTSKDIREEMYDFMKGAKA